jgi:CspA family cold shock protein
MAAPGKPNTPILQHPIPAMTGKVKWFDDKKGYGFITPDTGDKDVFVHYSELPGRGRRSLQQGERVSFDVTHGERGLCAQRVARVGADKPGVNTRCPSRNSALRTPNSALE